jgi:hypothetical protein
MKTDTNPPAKGPRVIPCTPVSTGGKGKGVGGWARGEPPGSQERSAGHSVERGERQGGGGRDEGRVEEGGSVAGEGEEDDARENANEAMDFLSDVTARRLRKVRECAGECGCL